METRQLWNEFCATGSVERYLRYARRKNASQPEKSDAHDGDDGAGRDGAKPSL